MNSYLWIQCMWIQSRHMWIHVMNSYTYDFIYEFIYLRFHLWIQYLYIFIYMNSHAHEFIYSLHIWSHIDYEFIWSFHHQFLIMNSYVYECMYTNSYMNSCKIWIHMIISYMFMNLYVNLGIPRFQMATLYCQCLSWCIFCKYMQSPFADDTW